MHKGIGIQMKDNTHKNHKAHKAHCVINKSTQFAYCGKSCELYFSTIDDALLITYECKDIRLCYDCWMEILDE